MMSNLKLPALLLALLLVLRCVIAAPNSRYAILSNAQPETVGWQASEISKHPFSSRAGVLPQAGLTGFSGHQIQKRKCNTATCVTQRLADFLVRSSNTLGPLYAPTNVGSNTYGKRDHLQPVSYLPL